MAPKRKRQKKTNQEQESSRLLFDLFSHEEDIDEAFVQRLLEAGVDINGVDQKNQSPLHCFCKRDYDSFDSKAEASKGVNILLKHGAKLSLQDEEGNTPLMVSIESGFPFDLMKRLVFDVRHEGDIFNLKGFNALALVLKNCYCDGDCSQLLELLRLILANGGDLRPNTNQSNAKDCLQLAINSSNSHVKVSFLLEAGVMPKRKKISDWIKERNMKVIDLLIQKDRLSLRAMIPERYVAPVTCGCCMSITDSENDLMYRVRSDLELLLNKGVNVTVDDIEYCLEYAELPLLNFLLETAPQLPLKEHIPHGLVLLVSRRREKRCPMLLPLIIKLVTRYHLDANHTHGGRSFLISLMTSMAAKLGDTLVDDTFRFICDAQKVDVDVWGSMMWEDEEERVVSPLTCAFFEAEYEMASMLLQRNADVEGCNLSLLRCIHPGFSFAFRLLFYAGFRSFNSLCLINIEDYTTEIQLEMIAFKAWLKEKMAGERVLSMQRLAAVAVRREYREKTKEIINKCNFSQDIEHFLDLESIADTFVDNFCGSSYVSGSGSLNSGYLGSSLFSGTSSDFSDLESHEEIDGSDND